jgi:diguanylate cyclase (GGDEF)-like protein
MRTKNKSKKRPRRDIPSRDEKMLVQVGELNRHIEALIKGSVEGSFDINKEWSSLAARFEPIRCREIKGCEKRGCPAYDDPDYRCWLTVGTFCGGCIQGEFAKKYMTCFECDVFRKISEQPLRRLYENINTLVSFLKDKAAKLHQLAVRDPLTRLYNRHFFNEVVEHEASQCERKGENISFIMIDLDDFKRINDEFGHLAGDSILLETAKLITNTVRRSDLVFRFGGDEFLVLMSNADAGRSASMVNRLLDAVSAWNRNYDDAFCCEISVSIGCSTRARGGDIRAALREADEKMYRHKSDKKSLSDR